MNFRVLLFTYVKNIVGLLIVVQEICKLFLVGWSFNSIIVMTHEHRMPLFVLNFFLNLFPQGFQVYIAKIFHLLGCACFKSLCCLWGYCRTLLLLVYRKAKDFCEFIFFLPCHFVEIIDCF